MTQDAQVILAALKCCGRSLPDCEVCPYSVSDCRELEHDAINLINSLLNRINELEEKLEMNT